MLGVPIGLVSLVDVDRQFFAGQAGLEPDLAEERQTPLSHSFCQYVVADDAPIVLEDARLVPRFADNLAIRDLDLVAYAGVPLRAIGGQVLGSLCVIDTKPRVWSVADVATLEDIAVAVVAEIEMRTMVAEREAMLALQLAARNRAEHDRSRFMLLTRIGDITSTVDQPAELIRFIAHALTPEVCDWCVVEVVADAEDRDPLVAIGARDDALRERIHEMRSFARSWPEWRSPTLAAYERQAPSYMANARLEDLLFSKDASRVPPRMAELVELTGLRVISAVPLTARGRVIGAISFIRRDVPRGFDDGELALHHEVARRLAVAVDGARMRAALEQRAQAAVVIETIDEGVVLLGEDGAIALWNPAAATITGIAVADALGQSLDVIAPELGAAARAPEQVGGPERLVSIGEGEQQRWLALSRVRFAGGLVLAMRDLTAERALEQTRHELIATVSHQLRTPVASVLAAAITLQRTDIELNDATRSAVLDTIVQQGQRLADLSADVLLAYRLGSGAHQVASSDIDLAAVLRDVVAGAVMGVDDRHTIELDVSESIGLVVGDEHALHQVFGNLVDNAVKYSPDGGAVQVAAHSEGSVVHVTVEDQGMGIPESEHQRVFERFHRLDPDMSRVAGGTGLGLFVVRELVQLMGGRVRIETPPVGTRFVVTLQLA